MAPAPGFGELAGSLPRTASADDPRGTPQADGAEVERPDEVRAERERGMRLEPIDRLHARAGRDERREGVPGSVPERRVTHRAGKMSDLAPLVLRAVDREK